MLEPQAFSKCLAFFPHFSPNGCRARVTGKVLELAPAGATFTTYNFEVEEFHTYFAGRSAVWVHNQSQRPCQLARATIKSLVEKSNQNTWDAFRGTLTEVSYADIGHRTRLQIFNETRQNYLTNAAWNNGTPPWQYVGSQRTRLAPGGQINQVEKARQIRGQAGKSDVLKANLKATGVDLPYDENGKAMVQAHHIVAAGDNRYASAREARELLADAGIDINEAANGVFLPVKAEFNDLGKAIHLGSTPDPERYNDWFLERLEPYAENPGALRRELQNIANDLFAVGWPQS